jgi:hypothetical protein
MFCVHKDNAIGDYDWFAYELKHFPTQLQPTDLPVICAGSLLDSNLPAILNARNSCLR